MKIIVTGAAGFIGSHLCRRLLEEGCSVIGIDSFTDYYPLWIKEKNVESLLKAKHFKLIPEDLDALSLKKILRSADAVFHLAAQAGVRSSWGQNFSVYMKNNVQVTQKLLEAAKDVPLEKFVFASSSSVYGLTTDLPMAETSPLRPFSPYGVTKLAAEQLSFLYFKNYGVPTLSLRFFTVYGPGQRPDMAFHKFFKAIKDGQKITVFGDGSQTRDFTYIDDIIEATVAALNKGQAGEVYNVGGGHRETLDHLFPFFEKICQRSVRIRWLEEQKGDVLHTFAKIDKARKGLGFEPRMTLEEGLRREWEWIRTLYAGRPRRFPAKG